MVRPLLLAAPLCALAVTAGPAGAAPPKISDSGNIRGVCAKASGTQRVFSAVGTGSTCAEGVPVMRAWTKAKKPRQFRQYRCGEVKKTTVAFEGGRRWFATWQCVRGGGVAYTIWTRY